MVSTADSKVCELCFTEYEKDIHEHLMKHCITSCPLDCQSHENAGLTFVHFADLRYYSTHLLNLEQMISKVKNNQCKISPGRCDDVNFLAINFFSVLRARTEKIKLAVALSIGQAKSFLTAFNNADGTKTNLGKIRKLRSQDWLLDRQLIMLTPAAAAFAISRASITVRVAMLSDTLKRKIEESPQNNKFFDKLEKIERQADLLEVVSFNGRSCLVIPTSEVDYTGSLNSHTWFTHKYGYGILARCYPKGRREAANQFVSLYIVLRNLDHYPLLNWPFQKLIKFTLMNTRGPSEDHVKCVRPNRLDNRRDMMNSGGIGVTKFCPVEYFTDETYGFIRRRFMCICIETKDSFDDNLEVMDADDEGEL